jgi:hypothetical protein
VVNGTLAVLKFVCVCSGYAKMADLSSDPEIGERQAWELKRVAINAVW